MTTIQRSAFVPYSPDKMYHLVDDIAAYPEFLPWCRKAIVLERNEDQVEASLTLAKGGFEKTFTTRNYLQKNKMIEIRLIDGPFKQLEGFWRFESLDDKSCKVIFDLQFEFSSIATAMFIGPVFQQIVSHLVDNFCKRADEVYGKNNK
ncbi:MAG: cyclase/dehydrase [Gammaproteobacteria bacterium]|jgi:ribosome-associated toxin RatA of RatAB toxin-antitoxin module|nr:cyclase/dehydrase [Gammaproteobacteria bacterium]